ncbi:MAG: anaerobic glycerol-3-phosphate dehydrogenase subunit C [Candidatus Lambdaproteobacteria bacterium]|nr:anaerobic glycerol-3-phosphate dehydrogenase subunit C [Candidatus Lambdaproteobacteria bacterium]
MTRIKATPTDGLSYSPLDAHYLDPEKLGKELTRVFDICHGCRLCFNLCPSFPALFKAVDGYDGDVEQLTPAQTDHVVDTCYQCKLCYLKCPYTPDDGHEFRLDFPRLMARAKAVRVKRRGLALRERLLGNPDLLGRLARLTPRLANLANRLKPNRWLLEQVLGIHRHKLLPEFHGETFQAWFERNRETYRSAGEHGRVFLFQTCFVNYNNPDVGKAALEVLHRNRVDVQCDYRRCCGMPALDGGDTAQAQRMARANIRQLLPYVREGYKVLAINPTCSLMLRKEYADLVGGEEAKELAAAVMDPSEFLHGLHQQGKLDTNFKSTPGAISYHVPCHLRAQNIGFRSRDVMRRIGGETEIELVTECCGHDGTWAMKREFFPLSLEAGKKAFAGMKRESLMTTDCPLAAIQFEQATGVRPLHPLQVLARAYRADGFTNPVPPKAES